MAVESRLEDIIQARKAEIASLRKAGENPFKYGYKRTAMAAELITAVQKVEPGATTGKAVKAAGRVRSIRGHGKIAFADLEDSTGRIQVMAQASMPGFELFAKLGAGDIIGVEGEPGKAKKGEPTIFAKSFTLLTKAVRPLPNDWYGLKDVEIRYRKRYLDLLIDPKKRAIFEANARVIQGIRQFLDQRGFTEVHTPILQPLYGGANAKPFKTFSNALGNELYLRIATELYLKRLIVGGFERVYEIGPNFRNESIDTTHNPEFDAMEFYMAYADYNDVMDLAEEMVASIAKHVNGTTKATYNGVEIDFSKKWERLSMVDAIKKYGKIDVDKQSLEQLTALAEKHKLEVNPQANRGELIEALFEEFAEPHIKQPTFITDFPVEVCPLAKVHRKDPRYAERFEGYVAGMEIMNAFSELNDPEEQLRQFRLQGEMRKHGDAEAHPLDEDYVEALEYGMPPTGGFGLGIARLVMLLTGQTSLKEVILFPQMKKTDEKSFGDEEKDKVFN